MVDALAARSDGGMIDNTDGLWDGIEGIRDLDASAPPIVPGTLHNAAAVARPDVVVWADCRATFDTVRRAGYPQLVALIPAERGDIYAPLKDHAALLDKVGKFVLAGGARDFVEELARRLGRHRVWRVTWPDGCADAEATQQKHGLAGVRDAIENAEPYPIEGIHRPTGKAMLAYRHTKPPGTLTTGAASTNRIVKFPSEGKLIVVTGIPNHGKSTWMAHIFAHAAKEHARRWAIYSPEMGEWQGLAASAMAWRANRPFHPCYQMEGMTDAEIEEGSAWCARHFTFISCDGEDEAPTLEWWLERARACVLRDGTTDFLIDPWNELDTHEHGRTEHESTGRALQRFKAFSRRHGANVWIVAHPTKLRGAKPGDPVPVPGMYDISGSSHWANKPDVVCVVHCPENVTEIHLIKSRFRRWGRKGDMAKLTLDPPTGRFLSYDEPGGDDAPPDYSRRYGS
jgi:twinkle protein